MTPFPATPKSASEKPTVCPFCKSDAISTTSKAVDDNTYWRCRRCGQIWNQSRLLVRRMYP